MRKKLAVLVAAVTVVGLAGSALVAPASSRSEDRRRGQPLRSHGAVGTWSAVVDPAGPREPFEAMLTLGGDGTVVEIEPRPAGNVALGTWRPLNRRRFAFTFRSFAFNERGEHIGSAVVTSVGTLHDGAQRFSGPSRVQVFDRQGNVVLTGEATSEARRFRLQRLS